MTDTTLYNLNCTGRIKAGHSPRAAVNAFARLANIEHSKAAAIIQGRKTIKKSQPLNKAKALQSKLEALGLIIELKDSNAAPVRVEEPMLEVATEVSSTISPHQPNASEKPQGALAGAELSLEPIDVATHAEPLTVANTEQNAPLKPGYISCPKCNTEQPEAIECSACGVVIAKAALQNIPLERTTRSTQGGRQSRADQAPQPETNEEASTFRILIAAGAAATLGALAWYWVAMTLELELGLLAWAIGGLVGFAAVYFNASGDNAGYLCGALALAAILGGKYMVATTLTNDVFSELQTAQGTEEYENFVSFAESTVAEIDIALADEQALREYLIEYEYVYETNPDDIPVEDLPGYREEIAASRDEVSDFITSIESGTTQETYGRQVTMETFTSLFSLIDILFILAGVTTAFKMAREGRSLRSKI